ncbi:MAG TPA: 30S ribosomal protein S9 [Nitrospiria bacterium]
MSSPDTLTATGKRKNSVARVRMEPGTGRFVVNERTIENYFPRESQRAQILQPFQATGTIGKFDVSARVHGGGGMGQAGAVRHAISKALLLSSEEMRVSLRKEGLLTRDPRVKERKKYGQKGARRRFQFSKR